MMAIFIDTVSHRNCKTYDRRDGHGDGHCYSITSCNACDRRDGDGDGHSYRIEALIHVIDLMEIVMEVMELVIK